MSSFPALDAEPPRRPFWRVALIPTAALAAVAIVVVLVVTLPGNSHPAKASPPSVPTWSAQVAGTIVGWSLKNSTLVDVSPNGQLRKGPPLLSQVSSPPQAGPSELLANNGKIYYVSGGAIRARQEFSSESDLADQPFGANPFGDSGNAIVEGGRDVNKDPLTPFITNLGTGNTRKLPGAPVDTVAADPLHMGAWVTVVSRLHDRSVDERIEYRTPGKTPTTLVTASRLAQLGGFKSTAHLKLTMYPSPSGHLLAIFVEEAGQPLGAPKEIMVLSRTGQLVAKLSAQNLTELVWFDSSRELFVMRKGNSISTWVLGQKSPSSTVRLPIADGGWGQCLLAPTGPYAVCASFLFDGTVNQWALIRLSDGALVITSPGVIPVDWSVRHGVFPGIVEIGN
jgi:hypothetical protein